MTEFIVGTDRLPAHLIVREIHEYSAHADEAATAIARTGLFERAGVDETSYAKWIKLGGNIKFTVADKLMSAMGKSFKWWTDPELNHYYMLQDLSDQSWKHKALEGREKVIYIDGQLMREPRMCAYAPCGEEFQTSRVSGTPPIYCSRSCENKASNQRRRERRKAA